MDIISVTNAWAGKTYNTLRYLVEEVTKSYFKANAYGVKKAN